jgi:hypothetical protein
MKNFSREIRFVSRPNGAATHSNFEIAEAKPRISASLT